MDLQGDIDAIANWVNIAGLSLTLNQSPPSIILSTNSGQITPLSYLGVTITKYLKTSPTPALMQNLNLACYTGTSTKPSRSIHNH